MKGQTEGCYLFPAGAFIVCVLGLKGIFRKAVNYDKICCRSTGLIKGLWAGK
jgi:hypothetical protein